MSDDNLPSKSFCVLPWVHLNTWPDGKVFQCCITGWQNHIGNLEQNSLEEIWNNDYMKNLRKGMLNGEQHSSCDKCFSQEANGIQSPRQSLNKQFQKHIPIAVANTDADGHSHQFKLLYWDFRFSNICNFKCRMCGSFLSSSWYDDEMKIYGGSLVKEKIIQVQKHSRQDVDIYKYLDQFADVVEEVYFAGGEPLLMEEHYYVLEKLIAVGNTDCKIRYNTNLSKLKYKSWECLEMWKNFKNVSIFASIDDFGPAAEYSRKGTKWDHIESNIKKVLDAGRHLSTSTTTNIFNIMHITALVDKLLSLGVRPHDISLNNVLTNPDHYHINILPDDIKAKVEQQFMEHLDSMDAYHRSVFEPRYQSILMFLHERPQNVEMLRIKLKGVTNKLDAGRDESFVEACPELAEWFKSL